MSNYSKATVFEQRHILYSPNDPNIQLWMDWAEKFINFCKNTMEWEVERGPGTSLGPIIRPIVDYNNNNFNYSDDLITTCFDCDWTKENGDLFPQFPYCQENESFSDYHKKLKSWFYNLKKWDTNNDEISEYGIDTVNGRFDFVVYTGEGIEEKIGFRIKYPVCSIGYYGEFAMGEDPYLCNQLFGAPSISIIKYNKKSNSFCNYNNDIKILVNLFHNESQETQDYLREKEYIYDNNNKINPHYVRFFGNLNNNYNQSITQWATSYDSEPLWSKDFQLAEDYNTNKYTGYTQEQRFKYIWKPFNTVHYHFSKTGDTSYLYVSNDTITPKEIGFRIITTKLDNGECSLLIDRRYPDEDDQSLCEMTASTISEDNTLEDKLTILPMRPFCQLKGKYDDENYYPWILVRAQIPNQLSLCKELYYVASLDSFNGDGEYLYINALNEEEKKYYRVIPFGDGENVTYLAFPIITPSSQINLAGEEDNENSN